MHDVIQQGLQFLASADSTTRAVAIFCATILPYALCAAWLAVAAWRRASITVAVVARVAILALLAYLASTILTGIVPDPRPYIVAHTQPLAPVGHDNGFPSDHTLLVAVVATSLWWIDRRWLAIFAVGVVLVAAGRLGIGAHHTLDVVGSAVIAVAATVVAGLIPLPGAWDGRLLMALGRYSAGAVAKPRRDSAEYDK